MAKTRYASGNSVREQSVMLVCEILENGAYANLLLEKHLRGSMAVAADRRLLTEIVNGTVRMVKHLDWVLNLFLKGDISSQNRWLRNILRVSAYQILFMERVPAYAVVSEAVDIARKMTGAGLSRVVNAVLRSLVRQQNDLSYPDDEIERLAVVYSHPSWLVEFLIEHYGSILSEKILAFDNQPPALVLRCNRLINTPACLLEELGNEGINAKISPIAPFALRVETLTRPLSESKTFNRGGFYVQNEASMLAAFILNPTPGENVYDLCCGVGGKSTHLAEYMNNRGQVFSFDIFPAKLKLLQENCRRLGIAIVRPSELDLSAPLLEYLPAPRVLLDAPCSGLGVLARRADARWKKTRQSLQSLLALQGKMLENACSLVEPGGRLLYSTCTLNPAENEAIVEDFLSSHPNFVLEGFAKNLEFFPLDPEDKEAADRGMLCLLPGEYDTDGMFFALMRRH